MTNFLSDLWHDLREKRLWPVAIVLLAALVAVPAVLLKSAEEPEAPAPATGEARDVPEPRELSGLASVKLEEASGAGSSLDTFDPANPFRPPRSVLRGPEQADSSGGSQAGPSSGAATGDGSDQASGDVADAGSGGGGTVDTGPVDTGGGNTGGGHTGGDTGGGTTTTTTQYVYVIDVTFSLNGRTRRIKAMRRLDMLPNEASPLLLFLGVSSGGGNAVFLVDSTLDAAGEGRCRPSGNDCAFLHIGPGSEHEFTNEGGDSYRLKIDEIRKVKVDDKAPAKASKRSRAASAGVGSRTAAARRFVPPFLADLVSVSSTTAGTSDKNQDRR